MLGVVLPVTLHLCLPGGFPQLPIDKKPTDLHQKIGNHGRNLPTPFFRETETSPLLPWRRALPGPPGHRAICNPTRIFGPRAGAQD